MEKGNSIDINVALEVVGGDKELLLEVVNIFFEQDYPKLKAELEEGLIQGNSDRVRMSAHSIKGVVNSFGCIKAGELAFDIENMGRSQDLSSGLEVMEKLKLELEKVKTFYNSLKITSQS